MIKLNILFCDPAAYGKSVGVDKGTGCESRTEPPL